MSLITVTQAKKQVRELLSDTTKDDEIQEMIDAASQSIVNYMGASSDLFLSTGGDVLADLVPADVQMACKVQVAHLYRNREGQSESKIDDQFGYGYPLCAAAIGILYHYRTPTLA